MLECSPGSLSDLLVLNSQPSQLPQPSQPFSSFFNLVNHLNLLNLLNLLYLLNLLNFLNLLKLLTFGKTNLTVTSKIWCKVKKMDQSATQMAQRHQNERNLQTQNGQNDLLESISFGVRSAPKEMKLPRNLRPQVSWCRQEAEKRHEILMEKTSCGTASPSNVWSIGKSERFFGAKMDRGPHPTGSVGTRKNPQSQRYSRGPTINKSSHSTGLRETCDTKHDWKDKFMQDMRFFHCDVEQLVDLKVKE